MVNAAKPLAPFDPNADFLAPKNMRFNGEPVLKGGKLNTDGITDRKLAQLYQSRVITTAAAEGEPEPPPEPLSEIDQDRADRLESDNNRKALDQLAKTAGVLSPSSFGNKALLAEAIVRLDPEAGKPEPETDEAGDTITVDSVVVVDDEASEHNGKRAVVVSLPESDPETAAIKFEEDGEVIEAVPLASLKLPEPEQPASGDAAAE